VSAATYHTTTPFYAGAEDPSLFWELTICECLATSGSAYQVALERPGAYGALLARFLRERIGLDASWSVVEVGGGYGSLMVGLLSEMPLQAVTMVDVSPFFSREQRKALGDREGFRFVTRDGIAFFAEEEGEVDLVVSNENLGDLPQVVGLRREALGAALSDGFAEGLLGEVARTVRRYGLDLSNAPEVFSFNLGPIRYLEAMATRARRVFLSEHSCDTVLPAPWGEFLVPTPGDGYPRRIPLKGHDEYSIRFGDLERVARALGYRATRFPMAEVVGLRSDAGLRAMARVRTHATEAAEVVHEFCEHVADYQCMLLERET
jgi:hypothetical protein